MRYRDELFFIWVVSGLCLTLQWITAKSSVDDFKIFSDPYGTFKFNHLVVDKDRGWVFIGAVNRLYQLSPDLKLIQSISTIPSVDEKCANGKCPPEVIDNYNKILVLDYKSLQLIACGSYPRGSCDAYKIENPLRKTITGTESVAASSPSASTVAFIATGFIKPSSFGMYKKEKYLLPTLYVGATYTNDLVHQSIVPAVSTRNLDNKEFLSIIKHGPEDVFKTQIFLHEDYRENYIIKYVYGFSSGSHSYFLTIQRESIHQSVYISKLIRLCQLDETYNSYTEIPIKCADKLGKSYDLAQAAFITKPNTELARSLGIAPEYDVLFVIFAQSNGSLDDETSHFSNENALCVYSLKTIDEKFTENIQKCSNGMGDCGLQYMLLPSERKSLKDTTDDSKFCGTMPNLPIGGSMRVQAIALITFETRLTAITAISKSDSTFIIIGTHTGHLKQIVVKGTTSVWKYSDTVIDEGSPINPDLQFDPKKEYLYAMTDQKLTKIEIRNLRPSISHFSPEKGPWEGGTNITIRYDNFDDSFTSTNQDIKVAGITCTPYKNEYKASKQTICITKQSNGRKFHEGPVQVMVHGLPVVSEKKFTFVDPKIIEISPKEGPKSGGTDLIIKGEYLNAGNSVRVFIGNISCLIFFYNSSIIKCTTGPSADIMKSNITLKIDQATRTFDVPFDYIKNSGFFFWLSEISGITPIYLLGIGIIVSTVAVSSIIASCFFYRKKSSKSPGALMEIQQNTNYIPMETWGLQRQIKKLVIEKHNDLDEEQSNVLKLPNISIVHNSVQKSAIETSSESDYLLPLDVNWEFPRSKLTLEKHVGEGEFGKVFQGKALDILHKHVVTTVAVKMLKNTHSDADMVALVLEMELMKQIGAHKNVLSLLGCCTQDGNLLVITEYALHGNLRDFLRKYLSSVNNKIMPRKLSEKDLLMFAVQVARGMEYLASIKCIHRDLAARNILVSEDYVVKIGDFGLARHIHQTDYYKIKSDGRLPIKWMAPEALCHSIYTTQSDVWSYGILLWEIMTLGGTPYPSFPDMGKLYQALQTGYRMEKPPSCSQTIYNLMSKCWSFVPEDRPSFSMILKDLEKTMPISNDKTFETFNLYRPEIHESDI